MSDRPHSDHDPAHPAAGEPGPVGTDPAAGVDSASERTAETMPNPLPELAPGSASAGDTSAADFGVGEAAPAEMAPPPQARPKAKGVADIVFLIDVSGSMSPCIDALRTNIEAFVDSLSAGGPNNAAPVKDWRAKVVGYRDAEVDAGSWFEDNPFVRSAAELKAQLAALRAQGGGDEPESLLDALYKVATIFPANAG